MSEKLNCICTQLERLSRLEKQTDDLIEFKGKVDANIEIIKSEISDIKNNHLYHLNRKINTLLFVVLSSVFITIIVAAGKIIFKI